MPIGPKKLLELVKQQKLVENLSEREITNPEGAGFDLRAGEFYEITGEGFLGIDERKTTDSKLVAKYINNKKTSLIIKPGKYYLIRTVEALNLPANIIAYPFSRGTLSRCGVLLLTNQVNPGYCGQLTFGIANLGSCPMEIELGARVAHITFEYVKGGGNAYRGQWQGGRVSAVEKEKQV